MKSIHPSFYRVRSNSLTSTHRLLHTTNVVPLTFFDSPPPPQRPGILTSPNRLPADHPNSNSSTQQTTHSHGGHPPLPLALGTTPSNSSHSQSQYALFSYSSSPPTGHMHQHPAQSSHEAPLRAPKRQRLKYQFDVGAYGIPKRCRSGSMRQGLQTRLSPKSSPPDDLNLSVQVGEDAYFVRDNAMGVADGVGGWSKSKNQQGDAFQPTPSALFARRLMHYCSVEVDSATSLQPTTPAVPVPAKPSHSQFSFQHHLKPRSSPIPIFSSSSSPWSSNEAEARRLGQEELEDELEDSLDELSEGIDVLHILERAYDQTIKAHVVPPSSSSLPSQPSTSPIPSAQSAPVPRLPPDPSFLLSSKAPGQLLEPVPLMSGSSTALIAVLDHAPRLATVSLPSSSGIRDAAPPSSPPAASNSSNSAPILNYAAGTLHPSISLGRDEAQSCDAVIRIAHIGDSMGMLVRGEEIVWRSEEMWWDFNMPLQLGPATHPTVTPSTSAHYFTLPVRADDILILASDGLSDNLWDEEVVDEVIKFRRNFLGTADENLGDPSKKESSSTNEEVAHVHRSESAGQATATSNEADRLLRRKALAGMLSEALCSRARKVSERRWSPKASRSTTPEEGSCSSLEEENEVPFARRAREAGKFFQGGKHDDISVIVAVISPAEGGEVMLGDSA